MAPKYTKTNCCQQYFFKTWKHIHSQIPELCNRFLIHFHLFFLESRELWWYLNQDTQKQMLDSAPWCFTNVLPFFLLLLWPTLSLPCPILALAQNRIICRAHWLPPTYISTWLFDLMQQFCNSQQRQNDKIRSLVFLRDFCCQKW